MRPNKAARNIVKARASLANSRRVGSAASAGGRSRSRWSCAGARPAPDQNLRGQPRARERGDVALAQAAGVLAPIRVCRAPAYFVTGLEEMVPGYLRITSYQHPSNCNLAEIGGERAMNARRRPGQSAGTGTTRTGAVRGIQQQIAVTANLA